MPDTTQFAWRTPLCELHLDTRHTPQCTGVYLGAGSLLQGVRGWPAGHAEGHTASCALLCCSVGGGSGRGCGPGQAVACGGWEEDCCGVLAPARACPLQQLPVRACVHLPEPRSSGQLHICPHRHKPEMERGARHPTTGCDTQLTPGCQQVVGATTAHNQAHTQRCAAHHAAHTSCSCPNPDIG